MKTINWKDREWLMRETWGIVHPNDPRGYSDEAQVNIDADDNLILTQEWKPRYFPDLDITADFACGLVCCMDNFFYGDYRIEAKLPEGAWNWSAIWLWGQASWPPEIDILEGYSNAKGSYFRFGWPLWDSKSNFHHVKGEIGTKKINTCFKDPSKHFIKYEMKWREDSIKIYADGRLHREISGNDMMPFRVPMRFILSTGFREQKNKHDKCGKMVVRDFDYRPYC